MGSSLGLTSQAANVHVGCIVLSYSDTLPDGVNTVGMINTRVRVRVRIRCGPLLCFEFELEPAIVKMYKYAIVERYFNTTLQAASANLHRRSSLIPILLYTMIATGTTTDTLRKQDIQTELNYWGGTNDPIIIDFAKPDGKERFAEAENQQAKHPVFIHDIRGTKDQYTLETRGFQYVHDEVPDFDDWTDEQKVIDTLIPRSEELVRKMYEPFTTTMPPSNPNGTESAPKKQ